MRELVVGLWGQAGSTLVRRSWPISKSGRPTEGEHIIAISCTALTSLAWRRQGKLKSLIAETFPLLSRGYAGRVVLEARPDRLDEQTCRLPALANSAWSTGSAAGISVRARSASARPRSSAKPLGADDRAGFR
jgi:hypothetical protein